MAWSNWDTTERQLLQVTQEYQHYIDERVMWIRSARPLYADFRLDDTDYQLASAASWTEVGGGVMADVRANAAAYFLAAVLFLGMVACNVRLRHDMAQQGDKAARSNCQQSCRRCAQR